MELTLIDDGPPTTTEIVSPQQRNTLAVHIFCLLIVKTKVKISPETLQHRPNYISSAAVTNTNTHKETFDYKSLHFSCREK